MPIKPENRHRYPANWPEVRAAILRRAGNRCEGIPHYPDCRAANHQPHPVTGSRVVLTIAHLDQQPENNDEANLRALCQRCHNTFDAPHRSRNAAATRRRLEGTKAQQIEDGLRVREFPICGFVYGSGK
jgi:5-methylcytosine-specific restriction endonuclease McrA